MAAAGRRTVKDRRALVALARELGGVLSDLGLSELEVTWADVRLRLQRALPVAPGAAGSGPPATGATPAVIDVADAGLVTVEAPMVGTFYRASAPTAPPYVSEGDVVKQGQILCIIEAMKLMNEIESKVSGRIVKILAENGQAVEYGQPLFLIEPQG